ncbi:hypothetical protein V6N13_029242 [Hibiscus sabdariffa]
MTIQENCGFLGEEELGIQVSIEEIKIRKIDQMDYLDQLKADGLIWKSGDEEHVITIDGTCLDHTSLIPEEQASKA